MLRYSAAQARQHLADLLNLAEAGEPVVIERRGTRFLVQADRGPSRRKPARRRITVEIVDPAIESGHWTWRWERRGLRFAPRRAPR